MSQTSDNSRTFRVLNLTDEVKATISSLNTTVTQHENINYVEVASVDDISAVKSALDAAEIKYKQCSYSTFVRFKDQLSVDQLNATASELCENVNILYSRVDENNHTGKLVVDRLEDYNKLKSNTGDVSFYRFSPVNVSVPKSNNYQGRSNENTGDWQKVVPRKQPVAGRYTAAPSAPVQSSAPTRGGRGGARGGRGGARGGRAAPSTA